MGDTEYLVPKALAEEWEKRGLRESDYTRKTMELSKERKALDTEVQSARSARDEYAKMLTQLADALNEAKPEPDWGALRQSDPAEFAIKWAEWQQAESHRKAIAAEQERLTGEQRADQEKQFAAYLADQRSKLLEAVPEWQDEAKAREGQRQMLDYAKQVGFSEEELAQVFDHRLVLLLRDAARYHQVTDRLKNAPPPKAKVASVVAKLAAPAPKREVSDVTRQKQRLAKTHDVNDYADLLLRTGMAK